jgi:nucleoside-diphosphate-sugar epimerase
MKNEITITGSTGFIGKNLKIFLNNRYNIIDLSVRFKKNQIFNFKSNVVIHLAGIAHDLSGKFTYEDYMSSNFELTKQIFNGFLGSDSEVFIYLSSVKASADKVHGVLTENCNPNPNSLYGKSKLAAENYIFSNPVPKNKRVYILRPCMIYGPLNKGNLSLLYNLVSLRIPWPLGAFKNQRSFCSIDNLLFIIEQLIVNKKISSEIYNISDDETLSTNRIILLIAKSQNRNQIIWNLPKSLVNFFAIFGDKINLPLNSENLKKLTESYIVSNEKIINAIGKKLPIRSELGMLNTFKSFDKLKK